MDIRTLLPRDHIVISQAVCSRVELLSALIAPLVPGGIVQDADAFAAALNVREAQVTTQVEGGIAFPHARCPSVRRLALTVGLFPQGVEFSPTAEEPCKIFFCIAIPAAAPTAHLPLLKALAGFVTDEAKVQRLLKCTMPSRVLRALNTLKY